jgi:competence ComEA-like helix-hairpin-helix protein
MNSVLRISLSLLILTLSACAQQKQTWLEKVPPLPQDKFIQVYTNQNPASEYTEPYRGTIRAGDNLEQIIVEAIASAHSSVDVAVQELRLPQIAAALIARHQAGVKVRVILENTYSRPFSRWTTAEIEKMPERERDRLKESRRLIDLNRDDQLSTSEINQRDALVMLDRAGIPRIDDTANGSSGNNLMHHKFVVVDGRMLIVTSANFTPSDMHGDFKSPASRGNANNLLKIDSPQLAGLFTQEFNLMWGDGPGGKPDSRFGTQKPYRPVQSVMVGSSQVEVQFSPSSPAVPWEKSSNGLISKVLTTATESVDMALFVFSDQTLVDRLEPLPSKGVGIRTLIDPGFAYRPYSEGLDMMGVALADQCKFEPGNRPWRSPITSVGVPRLPPGDLLHHKFGVVDQKVVITGSHNWTDAANQGNDETLLVIHSPLVAAHYQREFDRLYRNAILGVPPAIRKKADAQQCQPPVVTAAKPSTSKQQIVSQNTTTTPKVSKTARVSKTEERVNLNTATEAELDALPGVGPGLAKRIVAARQNQRFSSLEDLDKVQGVGPKLLKKLQDKVTW